MRLHIDSTPDDETLQAVMYGPLVLAVRFEEVTRERAMETTSRIVADRGACPSWLRMPRGRRAGLPGNRLSSAASDCLKLAMVSLFQVIHERYGC